MPYSNLKDFIRISEKFSYQYYAKEVDWRNVTEIVLNNQELSVSDRNLVKQNIIFVSGMYDAKERKLGPLAIFHPLRVASLVSKIIPFEKKHNVLVALLHDIFEDIKPKNEDVENFEWVTKYPDFQKILDYLTKDEKWYLFERLKWLTKRERENYIQYISRLLESSESKFDKDGTPQVLAIKLADRLDNTFDLGINLKDPLDSTNLFEEIIKILYGFSQSKKVRGLTPKTSFNNAECLYQLSKNIILLSLVRQHEEYFESDYVVKIFDSLVKASLKESERIALRILNSPINFDKKACIIETIEYSISGKFDSITLKSDFSSLDGLFLSKFEFENKDERKEELKNLNRDKELIFKCALSFAVIFLKFQSEKNFFVRGITESGINPD
ncbi:MAG: HD domain-containing protein [Calditrichaeota bacterium]|nr:MAG: HD domain-containing protein [Calditrichota bacterium]